DSYTGDPVHRFFQMWQQVDEGQHDLFTWVAETVGIGGQNSTPATPADTFQGGVQMGFYNMSTGDASYFKYLARHYAISDNYHQAIMGGTGANFISIGAAGDAAFYNNNGTPTPPPGNQIENPNPAPGTNNFYTQDGYAGGSYVNCANTKQPGVSAIMNYLNAQSYKPFNGGNCAANAYYLLNNYNPGYKPDGTPAPLGPTFFTVPPQTVPMLADALSAKGVSWKWYSGGWNNGQPTNQYCSICDPFVFSKSVMTTSLRNNLQGMRQFYSDVEHNTLPSVAFVRPYEDYAGHPADSNPYHYEEFVKNLIDRVKSDKKLWAHTAIMITFDEGGGYYDTGYIQPIDFFGDGTRIPMIMVSPYVRRGYVDHTYADHASIAKFIEANWGLKPLSGRSRDNLPNPVVSSSDPYVPLNRPAIGNLMTMFRFNHAAEHEHEQGAGSS
ncbi:MAG: phospholipase, partial [Gammaproteobacteria bacterium]|nr:phospholipase [Gammaproteobacteria bacterium]